jgi:hypothetical protein
MNNPLEVKPIEDVKNTQHSINRTLNQIKTDIICIKADISIIKDYYRNKKSQKKEEISKGWFWN